MAFIGRPHLSGAVLVWDGKKIIPEKAVINLQSAYENASNIKLSDPVVFSGASDEADAKLELVHSSSYNTDEGLRTTTAADANPAWMPIVGYDINDDKVFEIGTDTTSSYFAVTSNKADGNSGYQFMNESGTFMGLDTTGQTSSLVFQKADSGYIDFTGDATGDPILRINTADKVLSVNGLDITPYGINVIIPTGSNTNHTLFNLSDFVENNQYAVVNIDIFATTNDLANVAARAFRTWKLFISLCKDSDVIKVVGITEIDTQYFAGNEAVDDPNEWDVNINTNGLLFCFSNGSVNKVAFGATITKISIIDSFTGNVIK